MRGSRRWGELDKPETACNCFRMKKTVRSSSTGTVQITIRIPKEWLPQADGLAKKLSRPGIPTNQADAFRAAIATGFGVLEAQE
jgi:hypothetical protein